MVLGGGVYGGICGLPRRENGVVTSANTVFSCLFGLSTLLFGSFHGWEIRRRSVPIGALCTYSLVEVRPGRLAAGQIQFID